MPEQLVNPFLIGERVYLRPLDKASDLEKCLQWINDPEIRTFIKTRVPIDRKQETAWFDRDHSDGIMLAVVLKQDNRFIGNHGLERINWLYRHATSGTIIGEKNCWGKGYGSEAKMLLLGHAFQTMNLHRVSTSVLATNARSLACQLKCGFRQEGIRRQQFFKNGEWVDEILLGVLREEWLGQFGSR